MEDEEDQLFLIEHAGVYVRVVVVVASYSCIFRITEKEINILCRGHTVVQSLALSSHSKKVLVFTPASQLGPFCTACSLHSCVDFLRALWSLPTAQRRVYGQLATINCPQV